MADLTTVSEAVAWHRMQALPHAILIEYRWAARGVSRKGLTAAHRLSTPSCMLRQVESVAGLRCKAGFILDSSSVHR